MKDSIRFSQPLTPDFTEHRTEYPSALTEPVRKTISLKRVIALSYIPLSKASIALEKSLSVPSAEVCAETGTEG